MYDSQRTDDGHSAAAAARKTQFLSISIEVLYVRFFRLWALVGKSKNFSVSHCSAGLQKYSAFFSLSTSHSRIIFVSSGSNESSGTGGCHMCATAFTADTIIHSTSTLFLTQAEWVSTSHTKYEKKTHTLYADWNGSRNLNGEEWREEKKVIDFYFVGLLGRSTFRSVGCSTRGPSPSVCLTLCVWLSSSFSFTRLFKLYIFRHILHSLFRLRQHFASFLWWLTFCLL